MIDFSIIVPAYNNLTLLQNALATIINQKGSSFEIIIVDDSNNDIICNYIEKSHLKNATYLHNILSLGAVKNWNFGLSKARGKYLILMHHDEYLCNNEYFLQSCFSQFKETSCDAIISNSIVHFQDGSSKQQRIPKALKKLIITSIPSLLYTANIIGPTSCVIFKRNILVPFNEKLNWLVDVDWYYRMLKRKKIVIDNSLYIASIHGHTNQITSTINIKNAEVNDQFNIKEHFGALSTVAVALMVRNCLYSLKKMFFNKKNPFWKKYENS